MLIVIQQLCRMDSYRWHWIGGRFQY